MTNEIEMKISESNLLNSLKNSLYAAMYTCNVMIVCDSNRKMAQKTNDNLVDIVSQVEHRLDELKKQSMGL